MRLRPLFEAWRNIAGLHDDEAADRIEADAIDILIDPSGHSAGSRLLVFASKLASVQMTWIGHPGTTGLAAIDYRLTHACFDPPGQAERLHAVSVRRLPRVHATYAGPNDAPPARVGAVRRGGVRHLRLLQPPHQG